MRTLVALAVMGLCSALPHQAYPSFPSYSYGGTYQPKYTGPLASSVPAGVGGKVIPVSDTYEVAAAKNAFFDAYQKQLAAVGAYGRYAATPVYHHAPVHALVHAPAHVVHAPTHHVVQAPGHHVVHSPSYHPAALYSVPSTVVVANGHVQDTPEVAAAKSQFFHLYNKQAAAAAAAPDDYTHHNDYHHGHHY